MSVSGTITGKVNTAVTPTPTFTVLDEKGSAMANVPVTVSVSGGGSVVSAANTPGRLAQGTSLLRRDIDTRAFPDARCADGTPGVFYVRPAATPADADKFARAVAVGGENGRPGRQGGVHGWHGQTDNPRLPRQWPILDPMRLGRVRPQPPPLVLLIGLEIALEPFHVAVALEGEDMGGHAVEEPAVV